VKKLLHIIFILLKIFHSPIPVDVFLYEKQKNFLKKYKKMDKLFLDMLIVRVTLQDIPGIQTGQFLASQAFVIQKGMYSV